MSTARPVARLAIRALALALVATVGASTPALAQFAAPAFTFPARAEASSPTSHVSAGALRLHQPRVAPSAPARGALRVLAGAGGWVAGALGGGVLAYNTMPHCNGCEDPGLDQFVRGLVPGGIVGAALGAAAPRLGSACGVGGRMVRSLIGAAMGSGAGWLLGSLTHGEAAFGVPLGATGGAALGAELC